jgi:hypothetical protein
MSHATLVSDGLLGLTIASAVLLVIRRRGDQHAR